MHRLREKASPLLRSPATGQMPSHGPLPTTGFRHRCFSQTSPEFLWICFLVRAYSAAERFRSSLQLSRLLTFRLLVTKGKDGGDGNATESADYRALVSSMVPILLTGTDIKRTRQYSELEFLRHVKHIASSLDLLYNGGSFECL